MNQTKTIQNEGLNSGNLFYPRIIREFDEKDEPIMYGGRFD
ncbi:hypothetical protein [Nitrosopumilus sp. b3]|nr:hypothetical protein [Nitrosopumilus sp. b3]